MRKQEEEWNIFVYTQVFLRDSKKNRNNALSGLLRRSKAVSIFNLFSLLLLQGSNEVVCSPVNRKIVKNACQCMKIARVHA